MVDSTSHRGWMHSKQIGGAMTTAEFWQSRGRRAGDPFPSPEYASRNAREQYDSFNSHDAFNPYDSLRPVIDPAQVRQRPTLLRMEAFGASICLPSGDILRANREGARVLQGYAERSGSSTFEPAVVGTDPSSLKDLGEIRVVGQQHPRSRWLAAPDTVYLYPSLACNLEKICSKCYVSFKNERYRGKKLPLQTIRNVLKRLAELGTFQLILLGGEPISNPDFFPILEMANQYPFIVSCSTNATLMTPGRAEQLGQLVDRVQVSLDGASETDSEILKGRGTHRQTLIGLDLLCAQPLSIILSCVLTPHNSTDEAIRRFLEFARERGIQSVNLLQYYPSGDRPNWNRILDYTQNRAVQRIVWRLAPEFPDVNISAEMGFGFLERRPDLGRRKDPTCLGCDCGRRRISIYPNGDIVPCDFLAQDNVFVAGNVHRQDLLEVWETSSVLWEFRERSGSDIEPCAKCEYRRQCSAGCAAMSWRANGAIESADPRCPFVSGQAVTSEKASMAGARPKDEVQLLDPRLRTHYQNGFKLFVFDRVFAESFAERLKAGLCELKWQRVETRLYDQYEADLLGFGEQVPGIRVVVDQLIRLVECVTGHIVVGPVTAVAHRLTRGQLIRPHTDESARAETYRIVVTLPNNSDGLKGGDLEYLDGNGCVVSALSPEFNSGCLFQINESSMHRVTRVRASARESVVVSFSTEPSRGSASTRLPFVSTRDVDDARKTAAAHGVPQSVFESQYDYRVWRNADELIRQCGPLHNAPPKLRYERGHSNTDFRGGQAKGTDRDRISALERAPYLTLPILVQDRTGRMAVADGSHRISYFTENGTEIHGAVFKSDDIWSCRGKA